MNPFFRLCSWFRSTKLDADMAAEMRAHLDAQTQRNLAAGMSPEDARAAAHRQFGGLAQIQERAREQLTWSWLEHLARDVSHGFRSLRKSPTFAFIGILTVAVGIGLNLAVITLYSGVFVRPLPGVRESGTLVIVGGQFREQWVGSSSYPQYEAYRAGVPAFAELAAFDQIPLNLTANNSTERVRGELVSANYFRTLGVRMAAGRAFLPHEDEVSGRDAVAVISHRLWESRWQADSAALGREVLLNGLPFTIIGVAEPRFRALQLPGAHDVWVPLHMRNQLQPDEGDVFNDINQLSLRRLVGRLAPGATVAQANEQIAVVRQTLAPPPTRDGPGAWSHRAVPYGPFPAPDQTAARTFVMMLAAVTLLVLAAVSANAASLFLARAFARQREIAIRLALGGARRRVMRQMVVEGLLIATGGAIVGLLAARAIGDWIVRQVPGESGQFTTVDLVVDWRIAAATVGLALLTAAVMGLLPAWRGSRVDLLPALKFGGGSLSSRRSRLRSCLVVAQVALSLVLLIAAGLMVRCLVTLANRDPLARVGHILLAHLEPRAGHEDALYPTLLDRVRALPSVEAAGLALSAPFHSGWTLQTKIHGSDVDAAAGFSGEYNIVSPGFFATLRIPLLHGRDIATNDERNSSPVAVVNHILAEKLWPGRNPVGEVFAVADARQAPKQVVGVVDDAAIWRSGIPSDQPMPRYYLPRTQPPNGPMTLLVRTRGDPVGIVADVRATLHHLDPLAAIFQITTLKQAREITLWQQRVIGNIVLFCSASAVLLAMVGLYAALAQDMLRRTREIAIRRAIGAGGREVVALILRSGMRLTLVGIGAGLAFAFGLTRVLRSVLVGVSPTDPLTFVCATILLVAVGAIASWLPARRAAKVDPIVALRSE